MSNATGLWIAAMVAFFVISGTIGYLIGFEEGYRNGIQTAIDQHRKRD